jgi:hypothetical protein
MGDTLNTDTTPTTTCPIYHAVSEDLGIFPLAMASKFVTHERFMREHNQREWLEGAVQRAYYGPVPRRLKSLKR